MTNLSAEFEARYGDRPLADVIEDHGGFYSTVEQNVIDAGGDPYDREQLLAAAIDAYEIL